MELPDLLQSIGVLSLPQLDLSKPAGEQIASGTYWMMQLQERSDLNDRSTS